MTIFLQAYKALQEDGVNQDDLHDSIAGALKHRHVIRDPKRYLKKASFHQKIRRQKNHNSPLPETLAAPSMESALLLREKCAIIRSAVDNLPPRERYVIKLKFFDGNGQSCRQIARHLRCSNSSVRSLLFRAQKRLASSLSQIDGYDDEVKI